MGWQEYYKSRLVSAEEAAGVIKNGHKVVFTLFTSAVAIAAAIAARKNELEGVDIWVPTPLGEYPWFAPGWEDSFRATCIFVTGFIRPMMREKRCDFWVGTTSYYCSSQDPDAVPQERDIDVVVTQVSPPDRHGYCCFGALHWDKRATMKRGRTVLAEVDSRQIRTYGDNQVHVSEIDYFVEHTNPPFQTPLPTVFDENAVKISELVGSLIKNADTLQIGTGVYTNALPSLGIFDDREDLGWHSELTPPGLVRLVEQGLFRGPRKTLNRNKVVGTWIGNDKEEFAYVNENPLFEVHPGEYVLDIRTIAAHDNMVSINSGLAVDLTGQIAAESLGPRTHSGVGGQPEFAIGAALSRGGRYICVIPSTAREGKVSRIVPHLEHGTIITVPRYFADIVVSEHGIARLKGKTQRQRAEELTAIAHPAFRAELRKEAQRLFWH